MSNQIQFNSFNFNSSQVRVITDPTGEFWFCGTDVCDILGYANAPDALKKHCKQAGIAKRYISHSSGRKEAIFINEPNLYRLIIKSRKPEAEPFEAWVFEEVLPQIRKTGKYESQPQQLALAEPKPAPAPKPQTYTLTFTERELQLLVWSWFVGVRSTHTFTKLYPSLEHLGSHFAANAYDLAFEYRHTLRDTQKVLARLTKEFKVDHRNNWRVLHHLHHFDPDFLRASF